MPRSAYEEFYRNVEVLEDIIEDHLWEDIPIERHEEFQVYVNNVLDELRKPLLRALGYSSMLWAQKSGELAQ